MPKSGDGAGGLVLLPSAGMGHLVPFSRLAVALSCGHGCDVSVVTMLPTVSSAESTHIHAFPAVRRLDFRLAQFDASEFPGADPFFLRFEAIRRSAPLLAPLLAAASALVADIALASVAIPVARGLGLPCYVAFTSSAAMLSLCAHLPTYLDAHAGRVAGDVDIPGVYSVPRNSLAQALHDPEHLFTQHFVTNGRALAEANGLLVNSFDALEPDALTALSNGSVAAGLPPVFSLGPLAPASLSAGPAPASSYVMEWLEAQPAWSVVYVTFGSRKALAKEQLRELAAGLDASGQRFLWLVKSTVVDRDDRAKLDELLGEEFLERVRGRGVVAKGWVEQEEVLRRESVGLFVSHCGWNSVTEAAAAGVPVLAWPRFGDQRMNARVVARAGLGLWVERWSWEGEDGVVTGEEIAEKVNAMMAEEAFREKATAVREAAAKAVAEGGTSYQNLAMQKVYSTALTSIALYTLSPKYNSYYQEKILSSELIVTSTCPGFMSNPKPRISRS